MTDAEQLALLVCIFKESLVARPPPESNPIDWAAAQRIVQFRAPMLAGPLVGLKAPAMLALGQLAGAVRKDDPALARGTTAAALTTQMLELLLDDIKRRPGHVPQLADLVALKQSIGSWFAARAVDRRHAIPCAIIPYPTRAFDVGPIRFVQRPNVSVADLGLAPSTDLAQALDTLDQMLAARSANWLALVTVTDAEPERSRELAEGAVDVALAALQIILERTCFHYVTRISGRSPPPYLASVSVASGRLLSGGTNIMPGLAVAPSAFEGAISAAAPILASVGARIDAYLGASAIAPKLAQSWCDAAFWFHEGLAEPLETMCIAKLETALEALFAAGNSSGSSQRLRQALKALFGLEKTDPLYPGSTVTVDEFITDLVRARSRILHGTWSTLAGELSLDVEKVTSLVRAVLRNSTLQLDTYAAAPTFQDDIVGFIDWLEKSSAIPTAGGTSIAP